MKLRQYRIFVQDVGAEGYSGSGAGDIFAHHLPEATRIARKLIPRTWRVVTIPLSHRELWPDGKTGLLNKRAKHYLRHVLAED